MPKTVRVQRIRSYLFGKEQIWFGIDGNWMGILDIRDRFLTFRRRGYNGYDHRNEYDDSCFYSLDMANLRCL